MVAAEDRVHFTRHDPRGQPPAPDRPFNIWRLPDGSPWAAFHRQGDSYLVRFPKLADFRISSDGRQVQGWPAFGVQESTLEHLYLNQVLPLALGRQGALVLHASAVEVEGRCIAFLGPSGYGKSTLAASFATHGHRFLTDDGLRVEWRDGELLALPSHASIRLWRDSQSALALADLDRAPPLEYTSKARVLAGPGLSFCGEAREVLAFYHLGPHEESVSIRPAKPSATLMQLVRNSFLLDVQEHEALATHFDQLSRIANLPRHFDLDFPRDYDALSAVRAAILHHTPPSTSPSP